MDEKKPFIVIAAGYSNYDREYPAYIEKFGLDNLVWTTTKDRYSVQEHIDELKEILPKDRDFIFIGHSMGASTIIELMHQEPVKRCKGAIFVGGSRIQKSHWFFEFKK